ncbi:hypothetical protein E2C01_052097 [Portunus trituberculatus]|uniref:Uncharacterized protein n=1 Tax=Portunus trituberculatus TaxID=210409 RepID=A0A5B7GGN3_PORTR|nr:hypothetical protein [Portunus trituberculatus]
MLGRLGEAGRAGEQTKTKPGPVHPSGRLQEVRRARLARLALAVHILAPRRSTAHQREARRRAELPGRPSATRALGYEGNLKNNKGRPRPGHPREADGGAEPEGVILLHISSINSSRVGEEGGGEVKVRVGAWCGGGRVRAGGVPDAEGDVGPPREKRHSRRVSLKQLPLVQLGNTGASVPLAQVLESRPPRARLLPSLLPHQDRLTPLPAPRRRPPRARSPGEGCFGRRRMIRRKWMQERGAP